LFCLWFFKGSSVVASRKKVTQGDEYQNFLLKKKFFINVFFWVQNTLNFDTVLVYKFKNNSGIYFWVLKLFLTVFRGTNAV